MATIQELSLNPFPINSRILVGSERIYRIRIGDHRAVYIVSTTELVIEIQNSTSKRCLKMVS